MIKSLISTIKIRHVFPNCFFALLATTCYATDVEFPCDMQVTGNVSAGSFTGDGSGLTYVTPHYENTVIVSAGGTNTENGTDLLDALAGITDASATNPYLLKLEPGIYDIQDQSLQMKQYVDIEGSGQLTSKITGNIGSFQSGVVKGASNAELRFLTVENTGGGTRAIGIYNDDSSPTITNVTATASGAIVYNYGISNFSSSSPTITNVTATASGAADYNYGISNFSSSSPTITNVTAAASEAGTYNYGVRNFSSSPTMTNVIATASGAADFNYGIYNDDSSPSMTNVTATGSEARIINYGIHNYYSPSPSMTNVTATASGAASGNRGIFNTSSSPTMNNVTATASGAADYNSGIANSSSSPTMTNVTATASGAADYNYGVRNSSSSPTMNNVTATASGAANNNYGIYNKSSSPTMTNVTADGDIGMRNYAASGTYDIYIDRSTFKGATYAIDNDSEFILYIGASKLDGGANSDGTYNCIKCYDENYTTLDSDCHPPPP